MEFSSVCISFFIFVPFALENDRKVGKFSSTIVLWDAHVGSEHANHLAIWFRGFVIFFFHMHLQLL